MAMDRSLLAVITIYANVLFQLFYLLILRITYISPWSLNPKTVRLCRRKVNQGKPSPTKFSRRAFETLIFPAGNVISDWVPAVP